jgi:hypothetical protein
MSTLMNLTKETLMELVENYFPNEVESRPGNAEAFCNVLIALIDQNTEFSREFIARQNEVALTTMLVP